MQSNCEKASSHQANLGLFLRYSSHNILGMLGISCYILADTIFIAQGVGYAGLAALNLVLPIFSFMMALEQGMGLGLATRYRILYCKGAIKMAYRTRKRALILGLGVSLVFFLAGLLGAKEVAAALGSTPAIDIYVIPYLRLILLFAPFFFLNTILTYFVRNDGAPKIAMWSMLVGSLANVGLDYLFVIRWGWGMSGAAWATICSPIIGLSISAAYYYQRHQKGTFEDGDQSQRMALMLKEEASELQEQESIPSDPTARLRRDLGLLTASWKEDFSALALGLPAALGELSSAATVFGFNWLLLKLVGYEGVSTYAIVANLALMSVATFEGVSQGVQPLLSEAYAKRQKRQVSNYFRYALILMLSLACLLTFTFCFHSAFWIKLFDSTGELLASPLSHEALRLYFLALPAIGFNLLLTIRYSACNQAGPSNWIALSRSALLLLPLAWLLAQLWGPRALWIVVPILEALVSVIGLGRMLQRERKTADLPEI